MKTTALPVSRQQFPSWSVPIARVPDFIALTKPRVMALAVFTAAVGLFIAPGHLDPLPGAVALIGIVAGALPPVIGWTAVTGGVGSEPLVLFLIIFLWTPPHFWAMSLTRIDDYARAGVPMLPVVGGTAATSFQVLGYSVLLVPASVLPCILGFAGTIYGTTAVVSGTIFVVLGARLFRGRGADRRAAQRLFVFSISYLFLLFAALLADHWSTAVAMHGVWTDRGATQAERLISPVRAIDGSTRFTVGEA